MPFVQIGRDGGAAKFLEKLDKDLEKEFGILDIMDTFNYEKMLEETGTDFLEGEDLMK